MYAETFVFSPLCRWLYFQAFLQTLDQGPPYIRTYISVDLKVVFDLNTTQARPLEDTIHLLTNQSFRIIIISSGWPRHQQLPRKFDYRLTKHFLKIQSPYLGQPSWPSPESCHGGRCHAKTAGKLSPPVLFGLNVPCPHWKKVMEYSRKYNIPDLLLFKQD